MLISKPTPKGTGLVIMGDFKDLRGLYDMMQILYDVKTHDSEASYERNDKLLTIVPYNVRHAFQSERIVDHKMDNGNEKTTYYGFRTDWITMLFTINALRYNSGYEPNSNFIQGILYLLEYRVQQALYLYDPIGANMIEPFIFGGIDVSSKYIYQLHQYYVTSFFSMKTGKKRFRHIPQMLTDQDMRNKVISDIDVLLKDYKVSINELEDIYEYNDPVEW